MNWRGHLAAGFAIYLLIVLFFRMGQAESAVGLVLLGFASLLPDLDHPKSVIRETLSVSAAFGSMAAVIAFFDFSLPIRLGLGIAASLVVYSILKNLPLRHRGSKSLHQWRVCFLLTGLLAVVFFVSGISLAFAAFIFVGYSVHLLTDKGIK